MAKFYTLNRQHAREQLTLNYRVAHNENEAIKPRQFIIQSNFNFAAGHWNDVYVSFGGYFGKFGPEVFVAAPDMLDILDQWRIAEETQDRQALAIARIARDAVLLKNKGLK